MCHGFPFYRADLVQPFDDLRTKLNRIRAGVGRSPLPVEVMRADTLAALVASLAAAAAADPSVLDDLTRAATDNPLAAQLVRSLSRLANRPVPCLQPSFTQQAEGSAVEGTAPVSLPPLPSSVPVFPELAAAALDRANNRGGVSFSNGVRLWLVLRALDQDGRGRLPKQATYDRLTTADSPVRLFDQRRLWQVLAAFDGLLWTVSASDVYLHGAARVAAAVGVSRVTRRVSVGLRQLVKSVKAARAELYAAALDAKRDDPITRDNKRRVVPVSVPTQRTYERTNGTTVRRNLALWGPADQRGHELRAAREAGHEAFVITDFEGLQGPAGRQYVAFWSPQTYETADRFDVGTRSAPKRANRKLDNLCNKGGTGTDDNPAACYVDDPDPLAAAAVYRSGPYATVYQRRRSRASTTRTTRVGVFNAVYGDLSGRVLVAGLVA